MTRFKHEQTSQKVRRTDMKKVGIINLSLVLQDKWVD